MLKIEITTTNEAFLVDPGVEMARILRTLADKIEGAGPGEAGVFFARDINGNRVGSATYQQCVPDCLIEDGHVGECVY